MGGIGNHERGDEIARRAVWSGERQQFPPSDIGGVAMEREDGVKNAGTRPEVIVQGRCVALTGGLNDLPRRNLMEAAPRKESLRFTEK